MNTKVIAIIVAAVVVAGGAAAAVILMNNGGSDKSYNIISRVNSEGSGLYIADDVVDGSGDTITRTGGARFFGDGYTLSESNKAAWGGLILGDPGTSSIQHIQLATIADKVGLEFKQYREGTSIDNNTLYYVTNLSNFGVINGSTDIDGGIIWEPQFQRVITETTANHNYIELATTDKLFPGHTCCTIAANHKWLNDNSDTAVKFLAGYIKGVEFVKTALSDTSSAEYAELIEIVMNKTAIPESSEAEAALANIQYLIADDSEGGLSTLKSDIAQLAKDLNGIGIITNKNYSDDKAQSFADRFVDDTYLKKAVAGDVSTEGKATLKVAVITGDIHQIAIHVAIEKGYFSEYGITVETTPGSAGGEIVTQLISGDVQIGLLGAPPATINAINNGYFL